MAKINFLSVVFVLIFAGNVFAAGFEPGVNVRAIEKDGREIVGVIVNLKENHFCDSSRLAILLYERRAS